MAYHVSRILALKPGEIEKMSTKQLQKATTILNSAANKRVKRAYKLGTESKVIDKALEGGRFKTSRLPKSMSETEKRATAESEFMRVREFLKKETSSTRGVKKTQRKIMKKFTEKVNKGLKPSEKVTSDDWYKPIAPDDKTTLNDLVWAAVDKFAEKNPVTKEQRYTLAGHAYEVATRSRKPVHTKSGMLSSLRTFSKKQYAEESGQDLTASVGDEELATVFKNFEGI